MNHSIFTSSIPSSVFGHTMIAHYVHALRYVPLLCFQHHTQLRQLESERKYPHPVSNCDEWRHIVWSLKLGCKLYCASNVKILFHLKSSQRPSQWCSVIEPRMVNIIWAHSSMSSWHCSSWWPFSSRKLAIYHTYKGWLKPKVLS